MAVSEDNPAFENQGFHINRAEYFRSTAPSPAWAKLLQKEDWSKRGLIVWDADIKCVTYLFASQALRILNEMRLGDTWKTNRITVGTPAYEISLDTKSRGKKKSKETQEEKPDGKWVWINQISLLPSKAQAFYDFLLSHEDEIRQIASAEEKDKRQRLAKVYEILLNLVPDKATDDPLPAVKKKVLPISIPEGKYLTVAQVAEFCNETIRRVNRWIEKDGLACLEIPQIGKLVRVDDLNTFLAKSGRRFLKSTNS